MAPMYLIGPLKRSGSSSREHVLLSLSEIFRLTDTGNSMGFRQDDGWKECLVALTPLQKLIHFLCAQWRIRPASQKVGVHRSNQIAAKKYGRFCAADFSSSPNIPRASGEQPLEPPGTLNARRLSSLPIRPSLGRKKGPAVIKAQKGTPLSGQKGNTRA